MFSGGRERVHWEQCVKKPVKSICLFLHDLLIANFVAYGFYHHSLLLILSYRSNRKQRTKVNNACSAFSDIMLKASQRSILGPLLFNIYICDMFFDIRKRDIASYTDDNTPCTSSFSFDAVIMKLELSTNKLFQWFI